MFILALEIIVHIELSHPLYAEFARIYLLLTCFPPSSLSPSSSGDVTYNDLAQLNLRYCNSITIFAQQKVLKVWSNWRDKWLKQQSMRLFIDYNSRINCILEILLIFKAQSSICQTHVSYTPIQHIARSLHVEYTHT